MGMGVLNCNKKGGVTLKQITKEMLRIYRPVSGFDWMNYKLVKKDVTFHHIVKKCDGGREWIENGALLMPEPHQYLHIIEFKDWKTYKHINDIFKMVNEQRYEPTEEQREAIECMLQDFEYKHRDDRTSKGKKLIKSEYLKRW